MKVGGAFTSGTFCCTFVAHLLHTKMEVYIIYKFKLKDIIDFRLL